MDEASEDFRVGHEALGQRRIHDLRHHLGVVHHAGLNLLLHFHEVGRTHAEARQPREATKVAETERCLGDIWNRKMNILMIKWPEIS